MADEQHQPVDAGAARTWVVGSDGSDGAAHAAQWAACQGAGRIDALRVVTVWSLPTAPALPPVGPMGRYWDVEAYEASAHESAEQLAADLRTTTGLQVEAVVQRGQASHHLLRAARDASLLVVGSRGSGGFARLILGSTSTQCATHAHVPTAVIPAGAPIERATNLLVAFDGSENSKQALRWALGFAEPGSTITCLEVWEPLVVPAGADQFVFVDAVDSTRERLQELCDEVVADFDVEHNDIRVVVDFLEGRARHVIAEAAENADLLVMGARGSGAIGAALLGSVSTWLLHHVRRAMVIVPHGDDRPHDAAPGADGGEA